MISSDVTQPRWVLAFDGSCATCREISGAVARACGGRLEVLPLAHPEVRRWREGSPGPEAPTLLRAAGGRARAWTGTAMALPLARRLGVRGSMRVLRALGHLRNEAARVPFERPGVMDRAGFLQLGAGLAVAAGVIMAGATPAFAEKKCATAAAWAARNKGNLPRGYDEVIAYPMAYRRAIFSALPASAKSELWTEHLTRYQAAHHLSPEQSAAIREGLRLARPALFEHRDSPGARRSLDALRDSARAAFGPHAARAVFATLGPSEPRSPAGAVPAGPDNTCSCSSADSWCDNNTYCQSGYCASTGSGCGLLYRYACDGLCIQ